MVTKTCNINFSKLIYSLLEKDKVLDEVFKPAILFLAEETGKMKTVYESGPLLNDMFRHFLEIEEKLKNGDQNYNNNDFLTVTMDVQLQTKYSKWNGKLGLITDKLNHSEEEMKAFLIAFKQSFIFTAKLLEVEKKNEHYSKRRSVQDKVAKLLKNTNYTNDIKKFAAHFLTFTQENCSNFGDVVFLIKNDSRQVFMPIEATNKEIINTKEKYIIPVSKFEKLYSAVNQMGFSNLSKKDVVGELFEQEYKYKDYVLFPLILHSKKIGILMFLSKQEPCHLYDIQDLLELSNAICPWLKRLIEDEQMAIEKTRKDLLLKVTRKFHSSMDVNAILEEILGALHDAYPTFQVDLLLSHDWEVSEHLSVKPLEFQHHTDGDLAAKAYLTGKLQAQDFISERKTLLYVPLKGKQGVYGVFKMKAANTQVFDDGELEFIQVLADTGGNAIENAELYQQSQQHIANLQLINQTSQQLNENLKLSDVIKFMVNQVRNNFSIDDLGFLLFDQKLVGKEEILEESTSYFHTKESKLELEPIIKKLKQLKEGIFLGNCKNDPIYRTSSYQSIMAIPMIRNKEIIGAVIGLGKEPYSFSFDTYKLFRSIVQHSTLVFINALLHGELEQLVITDYLTKLYTRKHLDERITESLNKHGFGSFILIDIDKFKGINDKYGHQTGDEIIVQVANIIKNKTEEGRDLAARWGGEELAIYLPETSKLEGVRIAEEIRRAVEVTVDYDVTVSCGVSYWSRETGNRSLKTLFNIADKAMYKAKSHGRNKVFYD